MRRQIKQILYAIMLISWLTACNNAATPLPTGMPTVPVPSATATTFAVTPDSPLMTPSPTATMSSAADQPTATATAVVLDGVGVTISDPSEDMSLLLGSEFVVRGRAQLPAAARLEVALLSHNWYVLDQAEATLGEVGWQATLTAPYNVGGSGRIQALILDEAGTVLANHEISVWLEPDTAAMDRFLTLERPVPDNVAVRGYNFLFDGTIFNPVNNTVTIAIRINDCQMQVAQQTFILGSSATAFGWHGFIIVPGEAEGEACAVASFGQPGEATWREIQVPIIVYPTSAAEARQIEIARPLPLTTYQAGNNLFVYGTAPGITEGRVLVSVLLENGRIIDEIEVATDLWGYWEFQTPLPIDVEGPAEITVSAGEPDEPGYVARQLLITIESGDDPDPDNGEEENGIEAEDDEDDAEAESGP
jgi:hypothetical protein